MLSRETIKYLNYLGDLLSKLLKLRIDLIINGKDCDTEEGFKVEKKIEKIKKRIENC